MHLRIPSVRGSLAGVAALAAASVIFAGAGWARPWHSKGPGGSVGHLEARVDALVLDESTRARVDEILDRAREEQRALRPQLREAHEQLQALLKDTEASEDAVLAQADKVGALRTEAHRQKLRTLLELRGVLSAEQWEQLQHKPRRHRGEKPPEATAPEAPAPQSE
jgi:Spy/CpxP family protein refolding chaperone